jgi:hypothetical protein
MAEPGFMASGKQLPEKQYGGKIHYYESICSVGIEQRNAYGYQAQNHGKGIRCFGVRKSGKEIPEYFINKNAAVGYDYKK